MDQFFGARPESNVYSYPNPSVDETTIRFLLEAQQVVKLVILGINGNMVWSRELSAGEVVRGVNRVVWDNKNSVGVDVSNGVYLLKVMAGGRIISKKIAVVR